MLRWTVSGNLVQTYTAGFRVQGFGIQPLKENPHSQILNMPCQANYEARRERLMPEIKAKMQIRPLEATKGSWMA